MYPLVLATQTTEAADPPLPSPPPLAAAASAAAAPPWMPPDAAVLNGVIDTRCAAAVDAWVCVDYGDNSESVLTVTACAACMLAPWGY